MPVVPENFRQGALFQPLDSVNSTAKFDGVVAGAVTTRIQDGTWVVWTANGVAKAGAVGAPNLGIKGSFVSLSDHDPNDVVGHPDSSRLGQVTMLVAQHRGRTQYWQRGGVSTTVGAGASNSAPPAIGDFLGVAQADQGTTANVINAIQANACLNDDGVLFTNAGIVVDEAIAICLTAPDANGFIEYITL